MESKPYKEALKLFMKKNQKTYQDLADHLQISVPSVKRILNKEDLSFDRLLKIIDWLEISIPELDVLARDYHEGDEGYYTEEQELFFATDIRYWAYFLLLQDMVPDQIADTYSLSEGSTEKYLRELEKHELIKVQESGKIKTLYKEVKVRRLGELSLAYGQSMFREYSRYVEKKLNEKLELHRRGEKIETGNSNTVLHMTVSPESFKKWNQKLNDLIAEVEQVSKFETKFLDKNQLESKIFLSAVAGFDSDAESKEAFDLAFGGGPSELF